ncbi:divalent-cation tolerance protein CutA [Streptomyces sp. NPDC059070]|uniref:divalent-cation tolerance protein CutA n=1 Tax=Streptomyces sp. NPDC059070 TaxID=3346713 RepID=UPI0036BB7490
MANEIVVAQTTSNDWELAKVLARGAVDGRLAAHVHIDQPGTAVYRWKGAVKADREWRISFKTTPARLRDLQAWVAKQHSYELPEWITLPVTGGSEEYLAWVVEQTMPETSTPSSP